MFQQSKTSGFGVSTLESKTEDLSWNSPICTDIKQSYSDKSIAEEAQRLSNNSAIKQTKMQCNHNTGGLLSEEAWQ